MLNPQFYWLCVQMDRRCIPWKKWLKLYLFRRIVCNLTLFVLFLLSLGVQCCQCTINIGPWVRWIDFVLTKVRLSILNKYFTKYILRNWRMELFRLLLKKFNYSYTSNYVWKEMNAVFEANDLVLHESLFVNLAS